MTYTICEECQKKIKLKEVHTHRVIRCTNPDCKQLYCAECDAPEIAEVLAMKPHLCPVCVKRTAI